MNSSIMRRALASGVFLLSACAQLAGMDMRRAEVGMTREQAIAAMPGKPTTYTLRNGDVEYVLVCSVTSFTAMYSDYPYAVTFICLESGHVVDRGLVDASEEERIRKVSDRFVLREWQSRDGVRAYAMDRQ